MIGQRAVTAGLFLAAFMTVARAEGPPDWQAFQLDDLSAQRAESGREYLPFFDAPAMSMGLYELDLEDEDDQPAHARDEVYYIAAGTAVLRVGDEETSVRPGSIIFVRAGVPHHFEQISEDIRVLVIFAPGRNVSSDD
jgi:quercetin dioxygenase-like cupin family protein